MNNTEKVYDIEMARDKKHQLENGYTRISNDIIDDLITSRLSEVQLKIVLYVLRKTFGFNKKRARLTQTDFVKNTGFSRSTISHQLPILFDANILEKSGGQRSEIAYQKYPEQWNQDILRDSECASTSALSENECASTSALDHRQMRTECASTSALENSLLISLKDNIKDKAAKAAKDTRAGARNAAAAAAFDNSYYEEIKKAYHELLPSWPEIKRVTKERKENINLISDDLPTIKHWRDYFDFVAESEFLIKKKKQRLDFDFLIDETRFSQIWEGKYHD